MKIFVAGATGAIGKRLITMLVDAGHTVIGTTQHSDKMRSIHSAGATPMLVNALNKSEVLDAVQKTQPEIIVHQLTAIPTNLNLRHFDEDFRVTNRLRTEGTDHLLTAARLAGVRRFIAQSYAGWYARTGSWIKTEDDPLISNGISDGRQSLDATIYVEKTVLVEKEMESFVLRYGSFYGPEHRWRPDPGSSKESASGACRLWEEARGIGRSSTLTTRPQLRLPPLSPATPDSTTSPTTNLPQFRPGFLTLQGSWAQNLRGMSLSGWLAWQLENTAWQS